MRNTTTRFKRCKLSHFPDIDKKNFYKNNLNNALCMPADFHYDLKSKITFNERLYVDIRPCDKKYRKSCILNKTNF